ncbi:hypothetical protein A0H76_688 [Hepatospora eriocheir]|uniref:Uncharacterized protein n=1 Tax=Hepatospora eriocheir TaxID=1081669 RepID=A0A1X0Q786_9MICR|nr:hypothetical protein A0H76_688 [Hepatospora eriocheir]
MILKLFVFGGVIEDDTSSFFIRLKNLVITSFLSSKMNLDAKEILNTFSNPVRYFTNSADEFSFFFNIL